MNKQKTPAYVYRKLVRACPFCNRAVKRLSYKSKKNKPILTELCVCANCKKIFTTYNWYSGHKGKFLCMNPEELTQIEQEQKQIAAERSAKRLIAEEKKKEYKYRIKEQILSELNVIDLPKGRAFEYVWNKTVFSLSDLEDLIAAYIIRKNEEGLHVVLVSSKHKIKSTKLKTLVFSLVSAEEWVGKKLLASELCNYDYYHIADNLHDILKRIVINDSKYHHQLNRIKAMGLDRWRPKSDRSRSINNTQQTSSNSRNDGATSVYVYYRLTNTCVRKNHSIESVTAKTVNVKNNQPVEVNVFYCAQCKKYFINFEALQAYFSRGIYPALQYTYENVEQGELREASDLMLYGYNVREGQLTQSERRRILEWIIDSGLLSKAEIIGNLQFKVRYNGRKAGNERAKAKWQDDIQFVSRYVVNNNRSINATFVFHKP